jgi:hypothetical protein
MNCHAYGAKSSVLLHSMNPEESFVTV